MATDREPVTCWRADVEARRFEGGDYDDAQAMAAWCGGKAEPAPAFSDDSGWWVAVPSPDTGSLVDGTQFARVGCWIVRDASGGYSVHKPDAFAANFKPAEPVQDTGTPLEGTDTREALTHDRDGLEAVCANHGWMLRVFPRSPVTGERPAARVLVGRAELVAVADSEAEACERVSHALLEIGGREVFKP